MSSRPASARPPERLAQCCATRFAATLALQRRQVANGLCHEFVVQQVEPRRNPLQHPSHDVNQTRTEAKFTERSLQPLAQRGRHHPPRLRRASARTSSPAPRVSIARFSGDARRHVPSLTCARKRTSTVSISFTESRRAIGPGRARACESVSPPDRLTRESAASLSGTRRAWPGPGRCN